jgi:hypothetical protein
MPYSCLVLAAFLVLPQPVRAREIEFVTEALPWAVVHRGYAVAPLEVRVSGMCPLGGVGYTIVGGAPPPGVELSRLGYFSGVPARTGSFAFNVRVSNGCSWTAKRFTITVADPPVFKIEPTHLVFDDKSPGEQDVHVSAAWPKLAYDVAGSADWLKIKLQHGFTPDDVVHVRVDASQLKPGHYSATLTFSAWQAAASPPLSVELDVKANDGKGK